MTILEDRRLPVPTCDADPEPDLAALLSRVAGGDHAAFAELYDQTCARVYGMALRVLRDAGYSEETTQEVYLQVWRSAGSFDPTAGSAISWLITLTHRRAVDRVRAETASSRRTVEYGVASAHCPVDDISEVVESRERSRAVRRGLVHLTALQRESVDLAYFHGLSYREVADRLDVGLPTVKSRIRTGLIRLRAHVDAA
ncbi:ECF RNA polymerase sigma factor SigK [Gordonia insulae]|uniref:ECF RNA polymerase sigma factor SigK n=1 Tax=Gordonia insulae TaxID=2420509 RepID=A0A3G8JS93_9ACTN|nr:ECF RNA polymerase sigma factor SigK [Gordonia insulae]AZG47776.1 ECF RNA polymerase sigma factor SigK [Gordonia insulae]